MVVANALSKDLFPDGPEQEPEHTPYPPVRRRHPRRSSVVHLGVEGSLAELRTTEHRVVAPGTRMTLLACDRMPDFHLNLLSCQVAQEGLVGITRAPALS
jgi:hypothetical protein